MSKQFHQVEWDSQLVGDWLSLVRLAIAEDLGDEGDWTSRALVPDSARGRAAIVVREPGIVAGLPAVELTLKEVDSRLRWAPQTIDGHEVHRGQAVAAIEGPVRGLLAAERLALNALGRLSGIATLTHRYCSAVAETKARIYDTRKTTPGWRRLEKYAVRCGGGMNHRTGLFEAMLIKDNHLAFRASAEAETSAYSPAEAVRRARQFVSEHAPAAKQAQMIVEVEVDTLQQLEDVLPVAPDLILLDNMSVPQLREAVAWRDAVNPGVELEASGGVNLESVHEIACTGVDRISVGALTHSAVNLDFGLDWLG
jgi:nicotinate-nucleotide pyrophosphorylase (carboxylating)